MRATAGGRRRDGGYSSNLELAVRSIPLRNACFEPRWPALARAELRPAGALAAILEFLLEFPFRIFRFQILGGAT